MFNKDFLNDFFNNDFDNDYNNQEENKNTLSQYIFFETFLWFYFLLNFFVFFIFGVFFWFIFYILIFKFNLEINLLFKYIEKIAVFNIFLISGLTKSYFICPALRDDMCEGFDLLMFWFTQYNFFYTLFMFYFIYFIIFTIINIEIYKYCKNCHKEWLDNKNNV